MEIAGKYVDLTIAGKVWLTYEVYCVDQKYAVPSTYYTFNDNIMCYNNVYWPSTAVLRIGRGLQFFCIISGAWEGLMIISFSWLTTLYSCICGQVVQSSCRPGNNIMDSILQ